MQGTTNTDSNLLAKNLKVNKEKIEFWKFLMYATKAEVHIHEFQSLVYWVSIMECFLFVIAIALFISHPITFAILWCFITHLVRAVLGFLLLSLMPTTYEVIENIREFSDSTMEDVENQVLQEYKKLLSTSEGKLRPVLIAYFVFTIIDIIVDNVIFFFLLQKWANTEYNFQNIITLVMIVCFFLCNGVYFTWLSSVNMYFPAEMKRPINLVAFGCFYKLKEKITNGLSSLVKKTKRSVASNVIAAAVN